jgi:hypothetical protein
MSRARFGRGFGPVVRQTTKWMNEWIYIYTYIYSFLLSGSCDLSDLRPWKVYIYIYIYNLSFVFCKVCKVYNCF